MRLWTDLIDPATLTGYARAALADLEASRGNLAVYLPNRPVRDVVARFTKGDNGLVPIAKFRAFDADPEPAGRRKSERVTIELPAVSQQIPVSEYEQIIRRNGQGDESLTQAILNTTRDLVRSVSDALEHQRGVVISTGKATIDQDNYVSEDDFGRKAEFSVVSPTLWTSTGFDRLGYLESLVDIYREENGEEPGSILMGTRVYRALASGDGLKTSLIGGGSRTATAAEVEGFISGAGLPPLVRYDRRVNVDGTMRKVLPDDSLFLMPAPVDTDDWQSTQFGATFWGETLTAQSPDYGIADGDFPGLVTGVYQNEKPPMIAEVIGDGIALPVLANANLSLKAKVL